MALDSFAIGADIGGTHITAAVVDLEKKCIVPGTLAREKVNSHGSSQEIIDSWTTAIEKAKGNIEINKFGLAMPGPVDYDNGVCQIKNQDKYENLFGLNIKELLASRLATGREKIKMINDAAAFLAGEIFCGAGRGVTKAIGVTLGTGLGTCTYENGKSSSADLWSHPFKNGIAEDYLSTRWFLSQHAAATRQGGVRHLAQLAETDVEIKSVFDEFGASLGEFLKEFLQIAPADAVIIGGNISKSFHHFSASLLQKLRPAFPDLLIKTALLGEEAALLGAASAWRDTM